MRIKSRASRLTVIVGLFLAVAGLSMAPAAAQQGPPEGTPNGPPVGGAPVEGAPVEGAPVEEVVVEEAPIQVLQEPSPGTIKISEPGDEDDLPDNDPHIGCLIQVELRGFAEDEVSASVVFSVVPPTGDEVILEDTLTLDGDAAGGANDLDASETYDLAEFLVGVFDPQGSDPEEWHVRVDVETSPGEVGKSKVIWVGGCELPPPPEVGDVWLDKVVTGETAPSGTTGFTFSVTCDGVSLPNVTIAPNDAPVIVASGIEVGDSCTITELSSRGATSTSFSVDGGAPQAGSSVTVTITADGQVVSVVATNVFPAAIILARTGTTQAIYVGLAGLFLLLGGTSLFSSTFAPLRRRRLG